MNAFHFFRRLWKCYVIDDNKQTVTELVLRVSKQFHFFTDSLCETSLYCPSERVWSFMSAYTIRIKRFIHVFVPNLFFLNSTFQINGDRLFNRISGYTQTFICPINQCNTFTVGERTLCPLRSADKSLARPGRKQATATEDFDFQICYL